MRKIVLFGVVLLAFTLCFSTAKAADSAAIAQSIEDGMEWLKGKQDPDSGFWERPTPEWGSTWRVAYTGLAVKKFEHYAVERDTLPLDPNYRYYPQVKKGLDFLFSMAETIPISALGQAGDPDSDNNGIGIYFPPFPPGLSFPRPTYETGIALMAIAESDCPDSVVDVDGSDVDGWFYRDVAINIRDYLAFAQNESNGQGGWRYVENIGPSDNSVTGYAVLGPSYAEAERPHGFNIPLPPSQAFVKDELEIWIDHVQCDQVGTHYGGSGYTGPCDHVNTLKTGNLLFEMAFVDKYYSDGDPDAVKAVDYLVNHWSDSNNDPGWLGHYQAMYCIMKGLEFQGLETIDGIDWYDTLSTYIVKTQDPAGFWPDSADIYGDSIICTAWALLTLERAAPPRPKWKWDVVIENVPEVVQGTHQKVAVTVTQGTEEMGGFDFLIAYDASALTFTMAEPGPLYCPIPDWAEPWEDSVCNWEYFTYRYGAFGNCGNQCPSGLLRVVGIAETNNGPVHPACFVNPPSLPLVLFKLDFLVTDDRTFECMYIPIRFFWMDCGDNTISSKTGDTLWVDSQVFDKGLDMPDPPQIYHEITDHSAEFPTYFGMPDDPCIDPTPDSVWDPINEEWLYKNPQRFINFYNGGIDIVCAESLDARGDINLNSVSNEVADAVLFSNYFIYGLGVFNINPDGQIAATDVNADGMVLTVGDLVYQIRIIVGDAPPYPKLAPVTASYNVEDGVVSVDAEMGAAYVVAEGNVTPILLADNMEMKYNYDADEDVTRVLVYSMEQGQTFAGAFLDVEGKVVGIEMATYEGAPVTSTLLPTEFALQQNFPNPFNPFTTISFALPVATDYELAIYNVMGQEVADFTGHSEPGIVRVDWNASNLASGVYLYKLTAGNFTDTKKMVLLK